MTGEAAGRAAYRASALLPPPLLGLRSGKRAVSVSKSSSLPSGLGGSAGGLALPASRGKEIGGMTLGLAGKSSFPHKPRTLSRKKAASGGLLRPGGRRMLRQHLQDVASEKFVDLGVTRDRLTNFRHGILVPIMSSAMPDEDRPGLLDLTDQIAPLHASSISAWRRTQGIAPPVNSLRTSRRFSLSSSKVEPWVK